MQCEAVIEVTEKDLAIQIIHIYDYSRCSSWPPRFSEVYDQHSSNGDEARY